jgi:hypothetical protein
VKAVKKAPPKFQQKIGTPLMSKPQRKMSLAASGGKKKR